VELALATDNLIYITNDWIMVKVHRSHIKKIDFSEKTSIMKLLFEKDNEHALAK